MSLADRLRRLGGKLGILHLNAAAPATPAATPKVATRAVALEELVATHGGHVPHASVELAVAPAEMAARAVSGSAHATRVAALLREAPFAALPREEARAALAALLAQQGIAPEAVVADALARDRAVDEAAAVLRERLATARAGRAKRRTAIARELELLQAERARLDEHDAAESAAWVAWWERKRAFETDLLQVLAHLVAETPPVVDDDVPPLT